MVKLFQRSIVNYPAFRAYFQNGSGGTEENVFASITASEWELIVEMEAITQRVASLALVESQSGSMLSSTMYVLLRIASARMTSYKFAAYKLDGYRDEDTNERTLSRQELQFDQLSDLAHRCIKRTLHLIAVQLPTPSIQMGVALLLDPRTKKSAKQFLSIPDSVDGHTDSILADAEALLRKEHWLIYHALHLKAKPHNGASTALSPATSFSGEEYCIASDDEMDLLCGEQVSVQSEQCLTDSALNANTDVLLSKWLDLRIEWASFVKNHYAEDADKRSAVLDKLRTRNKKGESVWNVEELFKHVDVCTWFAEEGEKRFPSISKLARVWLGRTASTAFQKRFFFSWIFRYGTTAHWNR
ncbi:hypothetical protein V7S43_011771 [Phytophthora oleae]|uniref:HAT C-terminal dimerisation domain-containing protein n=1 Tax=Phytophthora oleae TaxID=2107226 RepID=A0ABD3FBQ9_9STRA